MAGLQLEGFQTCHGPRSESVYHPGLEPACPSPCLAGRRHDDHSMAAVMTVTDRPSPSRRARPGGGQMALVTVTVTVTGSRSVPWPAD
jgi:hypothetical protein